MNTKNSMRKGQACPPACSDSISGRHCYAKRCRRGFMMIESVFSIFIVGVVMVTFLSVMGSVYRTEFAKRDLIIASNLAQEGIEIVRQQRDNNWKLKCNAFGITPPPLLPGCVNFPSSVSNYCLDYTGNGHPCTGGVNGEVLNEDVNGFYRHGGGGVPTKFYRRLDSSSSCGTDCRTITATVTWDSKNITMQDTLYAWGDPE